ncbi:anthranilate synthase component [Lasallia pustulata]|uniref:Anthranilate synthase component n=1 Tax=Lasallia pustulata TaxID=136370 RepID=A0A1W5CYD0_9LECA|nr:anthranilate synthase component [Lasallia pustulata]
MAPRVSVQPSLETVQQVLSSSKGSPKAPNLVPLCASIPADLLTPSLAYLKVSAQSKSKQSFLFESAATTETIGRYSFVGADPRKVLKTGPGHGPECDPLPLLEEELSQFRVATIPDLILPPLTGGAIGYVGYDCVRYFEPKTARPMKDVLHLPEALFMLFNTIIAFDHFYQVIKVVTYLSVPPSSTPNPSTLSSAYNAASATLSATIATLLSPDIPLPPQPPITPNQEYTSNIGQSGYENHVKTLKRHITRGNIIQAVPSQRFSRPTSLHPFNIYRHLRTVNPSPYLFYIDCGGAFQLVGASPELLVKGEKGRIVTHPIAGTVKRGTSPEADEALANELRNSLKDRAEHVMLVDLARNDVNRVCDPLSTRVDRLMVVEKFSHVQHLVSQVSGVLRKGKNRFDAFRSIFPAGTVSGAPKVRAMELIAELEGEKRGVYAGAVGYFGYVGVRFGGSNKAGSDGLGVDTEMVEAEGAMDTCIALRTMLVKDGVAYLQAGGGVVFDSDPYEEWVETMNKLGANMQCIASAEERYASVDDGGGEADGGGLGDGGEGVGEGGVERAHVDMAAG